MRMEPMRRERRRQPVRRKLVGLVFGLACLASPPSQACWNEVAAWYGVNVHLLYAIAKTESNLNPNAIGRNTNGTYDIGLMQINSSWLPTLRRYGITEAQLKDPCTNLQVGAWILSKNVAQMGLTWEAVGAYNARDPKLRVKYAHKVYKNIPPEAFAQPAQ
jgi:soluble lytic murein transglycosylase-like protein